MCVELAKAVWCHSKGSSRRPEQQANSSNRPHGKRRVQLRGVVRRRQGRAQPARPQRPRVRWRGARQHRIRGTAKAAAAMGAAPPVLPAGGRSSEPAPPAPAASASPRLPRPLPAPRPHPAVPRTRALATIRLQRPARRQRPTPRRPPCRCAASRAPRAPAHTPARPPCAGADAGRWSAASRGAQVVLAEVGAASGPPRGGGRPGRWRRHVGGAGAVPGGGAGSSRPVRVAVAARTAGARIRTSGAERPKRGRKSKRAKRAEYESMHAPSSVVCGCRTATARPSRVCVRLRGEDRCEPCFPRVSAS